MGKQTITLYHFTSAPHMGKILAAGELSKGDVPKSNTTGYNAVWFTVKPTVDNTYGMLKSNVDKSLVRITFEFTLPTPKLYYWKAVAPKIGISNMMYRSMDETANHTARDWWIYAGVLPLSMCKSIDYRINTTSPYESLDVNGKMAKEWMRKAKNWTQSFGVPGVTVLPFPSI